MHDRLVSGYSRGRETCSDCSICDRDRYDLEFSIGCSRELLQIGTESLAQQLAIFFQRYSVDHTERWCRNNSQWTVIHTINGGKSSVFLFIPLPDVVRHVECSLVVLTSRYRTVPCEFNILQWTAIEMWSLHEIDLSSANVTNIVITATECLTRSFPWALSWWYYLDFLHHPHKR